MSLKLDTSNGHTRVPQTERTGHQQLAVETMSIPSLL